MSISLRSLAVMATAAIAVALAACTGDEAPERPEQLSDEAGEASEVPEESASPEEDDEVADAGPPVLVPTGASGLESEVGDLTLADVHGDDLGWVVVGNVSEPGDRPAAVLANSEDGVDWELDELPAPDGSEHRAAAVVRVHNTTVVVGATRVGPDYHLVIWVGEPGAWDLRELHEELGTARSFGIRGAVTTDDDVVLVVGTIIDEDGTRTPSTWRIDPTGQADHTTPFGGPGALNDVTILDGDLLAVGSSGDDTAFPPPIVLRSDDHGATWSTVDTTGLDGGELNTVQPLDGGFAIGGRLDGSGSGTAALWTSSDGSEWNQRISQGERGTSYIHQVHRLDGRLLALGTWLELTASGTDAFGDTRFWPGEGSRGSFGASAQHDGRIVAVGSRENFPRGLLTATDPESWQTIDLADQTLANTTGVSNLHVADLASSPDDVLLVGTETTLTHLRSNERLFAGLSPSYESSTVGLSSEGAFSSVEYRQDHGWIAVGFDRDEGVWWDGTRAAVSEDAQNWTELDVEDSSADRILEVFTTTDRVLAFGLGWVDGSPEGTIWELEDGRFTQAEADGLDDWVGLSGCVHGDNLVLHVYQGGATRNMAVSTDGGRSFEVVGDGPLPAATGLSCGIDDEGNVLVLTFRSGTNEVHRYDLDSGAWTELSEPTAGSRVSVTNVGWAPEVGWYVVGTRVEVEDDEPLMRVSADLDHWRELAFEGEPTRAAARRVTSTDRDLVVYGSIDGEPEIWTLPLAELD